MLTGLALNLGGEGQRPLNPKAARSLIIASELVSNRPDLAIDSLRFSCSRGRRAAGRRRTVVDGCATKPPRRDGGDRRRIRMWQSLAALAVMRLLPEPLQGSVGGPVSLSWPRLLLPCLNREIQRVRGKDISMIFQEPIRRSSGHYRRRSTDRGDPASHRLSLGKESAPRDRALASVRIPDARAADDYPHQMAGA